MQTKMHSTFRDKRPWKDHFQNRICVKIAKKKEDSTIAFSASVSFFVVWHIEKRFSQPDAQMKIKMQTAD